MADIKTVTLTGGEVQVSIERRHCHIRNLGNEMIYASLKSGIVPDADGVLGIPAGAKDVLTNTDGYIYIKGTGKVQLVGSEFASGILGGLAGGDITAAVAAEVAKIVAGAPADFDTLKEISDWIYSHADSAAAMNSEIQTIKADIADGVPANGGNADTLKGHSAYVKQYNYEVHPNLTDNLLTEDFVTDISNTEAVSLGLPDQWYMIINYAHGILNGYNVQVAIPFASGYSPYFRRGTGVGWESWHSYITDLNIGFQSVQSADTIDGKHASDFIKREGTTDLIVVPYNWKIDGAIFSSSIQTPNIICGFYMKNTTTEIINLTIEGYSDKQINLQTGYGTGTISEMHLSGTNREWWKNNNWGPSITKCSINIPAGKTGYLSFGIKDADIINVTVTSLYSADGYNVCTAASYASNADTLDGLHANQIASNPNLLINPDFRINQREKSGVISSTGYFVDRWQLVSGTAEITPNGIILNGSIKQILEYTVGMNVTASSSAGAASYDDNTRVFTLTASGETIEWAKLEVGSIATPFSPPDPTTELNKCRRYYQVSGQTLFCHSYNEFDGCFFQGSLPVRMRVRPLIIPPKFDESTPLLQTEIVNGFTTGWRLGGYTSVISEETFQIVFANSDVSKHSINLRLPGFMYPIALDAEIY